MNVALWVLQVLTALAFGGHGLLMVRDPQRMGQRVPWVGALPGPFVRALGVLEILGAIGVVLPAASGVLPSLTVAAAGGLVAMMLLAILFHITRREWPNTGLNIVLGLLAFAVAYGRSVIEPL
ncbi:MAG TPA: DoxX family protein [Candidatus Limnocylindria bacterium]|nr:DoxX family protein [Candidatus Limnocylindria bacterium]